MLLLCRMRLALMQTQIVLALGVERTLVALEPRSDGVARLVVLLQVVRIRRAVRALVALEALDAAVKATHVRHQLVLVVVRVRAVGALERARVGVIGEHVMLIGAVPVCTEATVRALIALDVTVRTLMFTQPTPRLRRVRALVALERSVRPVLDRVLPQKSSAAVRVVRTLIAHGQLAAGVRRRVTTHGGQILQDDATYTAQHGEAARGLLHRRQSSVAPC